MARTVDPAGPSSLLTTVPAVGRLGLRNRRSAEGVHVTIDHDGRWDSPLAPVGPGLAALVCDSATGIAVSLLDEHARISTALLTVDLLGPIPARGEIEAVARVETDGEIPPVGDGDFVATTAVLRDGRGQEFGRAIGWWARRPPLASGHSYGALPIPAVVPLPAASTDDPLRESLGLSGLERGPDTIAFRLDEVGNLINRLATLHGGVGALLAQVAAVAAVDAVPPPRVLSMSCHYHRAAGVDGGPVIVRGEVTRRGRTTAVATGTIDTPDGRPALVTTVTMALTPDSAR